MKATISVDIWSDISCPWCAIGSRTFEAGLAAFDHADMVLVTYRSYVLNPHAPIDFDGSAREFLVRFKGIPAARVESMAAHVRSSAAEVGLVYDIDKIRVTNTAKAHQVLHFAKKQHRQIELVDRFFTALFAEGRHLGRDDDLADLAADTGLDRADVLSALASAEFLDAVESDIEQGGVHRISSVPFYLFNGTVGLSGVQAPDIFTALLRALYDENIDVA